MDNCENFLSECHDGNYQAMENFLLDSISPNVQNVEGDTALQISAAYGFIDIVNLLLRNGAIVDLPNNYGWTPLMHAAHHGHSDVVALLIKMKAKVNISNRLGLRPIDVAAWSGNLSCVEMIIEAGAVIDNMQYNTQNDLCDLSSLMAASLQEHDSILKILLEKGSSIDQASSITGLTPLMLAACSGYRHIVEILVEWGCDVNKIDNCGRTALDLAIVCCKQDVINYLENVTVPNSEKSLSGVPCNTNILQAVRNGDIAQIQSLLQYNQNLCNYLDLEDGTTPLMIACMFGHNNIVDVLICNGANLNAQDVSNGWTPLMYAVFHRQAEIVHLLLDKGADVDICTYNGYTALDLATHIDSSETDIVETLASHSAPAEIVDMSEYLLSSPNTSFKRNQLSVEKVSTRNDSQAKIKDWIGGISSHIRQLSKSSASALSPSVDSQAFDETLSDVFLDDSIKEESSSEGKYLCISKFYAPNQRFAHLLKEQKVEAINLPSISYETDCIDLIKTLYPKKSKVHKSKSVKPSFNSLRTPNLLKHYFQKYPLASENKVSAKKTVTSERLEVEDISQQTATLNLQSESNLQLKSKNSDLKLQKAENAVGTVEGLTALLSQESLKKYAEKFRDQEIDLETFQYLTEDDLNKIGINSLESRHKLMNIIDKLKQN